MTDNKFNKAIKRLMAAKGVKPSKDVIKAARARLVGMDCRTHYKIAKEYGIHQSSLTRLVKRVIAEDQADA